MAGHMRRRVPGDDLLPRVSDRRVPAGSQQLDARSPRRVAEMLGVSRASAGEMLKRLEAEGLVERGEQKEAILTDDRDRAGRARRPQAPDHRAPAHRLHGLHGRREAHVHADELGDTFTDDMVERIEERLGNPDRCPHGWPVDPAFEQTREQGAGAARRPRDRAARRRSSGSPSTTASSSTGSTTRASSPGAQVGHPRGAAGGGPVQGAARRATSGRSARRPQPASTSARARRAAPPDASRSGARSPRS